MSRILLTHTKAGEHGFHLVVHTFTTLLGKTSHTTLGSVKKLGEVHNKNMDFPGDVQMNIPFRIFNMRLGCLKLVRKNF